MAPGVIRQAPTSAFTPKRSRTTLKEAAVRSMLGVAGPTVLGVKVSVVHLDDEAMAFFAARPSDDPAAIADARIREYAEERGGRTLEYWRLSLGRIWGVPIMMTADEVAQRLGWSVGEARDIDAQTMSACGYSHPKP